MNEYDVYCVHKLSPAFVIYVADNEPDSLLCTCHLVIVFKTCFIFPLEHFDNKKHLEDIAKWEFSECRPAFPIFAVGFLLMPMLCLWLVTLCTHIYTFISSKCASPC